MNFIRLVRALRRNTGRFWHLTDCRQLCSPCRSLKLWMVMRLYGKSGLQSHIRKHCELGKHFEGLVQSDSRFEVLILTPMVCCVIRFCRNTSLYILWKNLAVLIATEQCIACCPWFVILMKYFGCTGHGTNNIFTRLFSTQAKWARCRPWEQSECSAWRSCELWWKYFDHTYGTHAFGPAFLKTNMKTR